MLRATLLKSLQDNQTGQLIPAYRDVDVVEQGDDYCLIDLGDHQPRRVARKHIRPIPYLPDGPKSGWPA